jgi:hypothetical protein
MSRSRYAIVPGIPDGVQRKLAFFREYKGNDVYTGWTTESGSVDLIIYTRYVKYSATLLQRNVRDWKNYGVRFTNLNV